MTDALGGNAGGGGIASLFILAIVVCLAVSFARAWLTDRRSRQR